MNTLTFIEVNDANFCISDLNGIITQEPAYSIITEEKMIMGRDAMQQACSLSQTSYTQHWQQLKPNPVAPINPQVRNQLDLVWHQIKKWHYNFNIQQAIFCVPSHYSDKHCQILAGITNSLGIKTKGFVYRSLVDTLYTKLPQEYIWHLDIQLNQTVIQLIQSEIVYQDDLNNDSKPIQHQSIKLGKHFIIPDIGLFQLQDQWLACIREYLLKQSRFDIAHEARYEQQIFNELFNYINSTEELISIHVQSSKNTINQTMPLRLLHDVTRQTMRPLQQFVDKTIEAPWITVTNKVPVFLLPEALHQSTQITSKPFPPQHIAKFESLFNRHIPNNSGQPIVIRQWQK